MFSAKELDFKKFVALSQWDRIVITMALACSIPLVVHAIPLLAGPELGMRWLPMFYAPLMASLCFRPHVSLIVGVSAPMINHALFGMPDGRMLPGLIFELVVLNAIVAFVNPRQKVRGWHVVLVFVAVRGLSRLIFSVPGEAVVPQLSRSLLAAWPGMILLAVLAEIIGQVVRRNDP